MLADAHSRFCLGERETSHRCQAATRPRSCRGHARRATLAAALVDRLLIDLAAPPWPVHASDQAMVNRQPYLCRADHSDRPA